ncbi:fumarylacetoacetate hydrolase family protein [Lacisediminimonas profundi]|uniref:fumarylacetoacetate hydrolase family protein n=1 Tax=Lacisediminimonas profundi TaxID=2603856 RepID=UPI00124B3CCE|nr:fumarylacetoacetate hydrolase family protein [Lacisediminimonas profundi]
MKLCRFNDDRLGLVDGNTVRDVTAALDVLPACRYPFPRHDLMIANLDQVCKRAAELALTAPAFALDGVTLLSPVANPGKVLAAPVNYQKHLDEARSQVEIHNNMASHIAEIQRVGLFLKATSSIVGPGAGVRIAHPDRRNDHEAELVAIIGKTVRNATHADALQYVAAYCIGLDMTTRGPEERSLRKSIDSYTVLGPWLVTADEIRDPYALGFTLSVNGEVRQSANTRDLILDIADLIVFASSFYTLEPGDILFTGTPEGVGPVVPGDTIFTEFDGIGSMSVGVRLANA